MEQNSENQAPEARLLFTNHVAQTLDELVEKL